MNVTGRQRVTLVRFGKLLVFAGAILGATKLTLEFPAISSASTATFSFLIIVVLSAFFGDLLVAIATSIVATLCFDYFYLPPAGTLNIGAFPDWISLAAFLLASVIISRLTASAAEHALRVSTLNRALVQVKEFGESLLSTPQDDLTLSAMAKAALRIFSLEYCSIHVYGEGKWQHFTGAAASEMPQELEARLKVLQDHPTDVMELADEDMLGVRTMPINKGKVPLAWLAVKSSTLPAEALGTLAYMIGAQLSTMMKDNPSSNRTADRRR